MIPLDPQNPAHRHHAIQERMAELQRDGRTYDQAWQTMNSQADMQPFVAAMKPSESEAQSVAAAITQTLRGQMVTMALHAVEATLNALHLGATKEAILQSPLLRPLVSFSASLATANARTVTYSPSETDATLESLAASCTVQILRAAIGGAVSVLSRFIAEDAAASEVYADPLFAPLVDWLKKTTGEDLRTGNSAIAGHALQYFIKGAIAKRGLAALRKLTLNNPAFAQLAPFLTGETTANHFAGADLASRSGRAAALATLVGQRQAEHGETYDQAFAAVKRDAAHAALFQSMQQPTAS